MRAVAFTPGGDVVIAGETSGDVVFPGGISLSTRSSSSSFVARLTAFGSGIVSADDDERAVATLMNAPVPNPTRQSASVGFALQSAGYVTLDVFDVQGRRTARVLSQHLPAGPHHVRAPTGTLAPGLYFLRLTTESAVATQPLVVVR